MKKRSWKDDKNRNNIPKTDFEKSGNIWKKDQGKTIKIETTYQKQTLRRVKAYENKGHEKTIKTGTTYQKQTLRRVKHMKKRSWEDDKNRKHIKNRQWEEWKHI
jgi:hypothetical protein